MNCYKNVGLSSSIILTMKRKIGVTFQIIGNTSEEFGWNKTNLKSAQSELM